MSNVRESPPVTSTLRSLRWALWLSAAIASFGVGLALYGHKGADQSGAQSAAAPFGGHFALTASNGATISDRTLAGKPYAIFFGFTRCPEVCPTTLARMSRLRGQLGADGAKFTIVFVSVDPEHDKPATIGDYVALFNTPVIGATGTPAQLAQIEKGFGVYVNKVPLPGGDYTVDHSAAVYLMTAQGQLADVIDFHEPEAASLTKLRKLVS